MAGGPAQKCQVSARGSRSSAPGCARGAAAGALGPARAAQRQPLLQSPLQVWQCGFTLYAPPPPPRPRSSSSAAAFLPPARSGPPAARPSSPPPATCGPGERRCSLGPAAGARAHGVGSCGPAESAGPIGCPASAARLGGGGAARASSRLARSFGGAYTCVTDRAESQLLPGSAADVSDPQPLGGRIVQAE